MNPENNALRRTYFIGGAPRVGKSLLAYSLAKQISGHVVSTDAIRSAAKKANQDNDSDLFKINTYNSLSESEWLTRHFDTPERVVNDQNSESRAFWPSIISFCNTFCEDSAYHIVEGVALLPELVSTMEHKPHQVIYIGNTSQEHLHAILKYSQQNPEQDWMNAMGYSEERIAAMANFVRHMSLYFKAEAEKYGFRYYEINDNSFEKSIAEIIHEIIIDQ